MIRAHHDLLMEQHPLENINAESSTSLANSLGLKGSNHTNSALTPSITTTSFGSAPHLLEFHP